ncbi:MAG: hypothetical protein H7305_16270 [Gemmatimonadaceae bacterium]|nr:hypothetical protein [Gemmatimonadaceae bacterium]
MGKLIVPLVIGLLMGISGGGFFTVFRASAAHATAIADARKHGIKPTADSTHAEGDSTAATDSAAVGVVAHDSAVAGSHEAAPAAAAPVADAQHAPDMHAAPTTKANVTPVRGTSAPATTVAAAPTAPAATDAETEQHQKRLAKIFSTMSAKDASKVLTQMSDADVGVILNQLGERQAAAILTNLPPQRAALLSQMPTRRRGGGE